MSEQPRVGHASAGRPATGPVAPRPPVVRLTAGFLGLVGLSALGLTIWLLVLPFGFATKDGEFRIGYFIGSLLCFGVIAVLFGLLAFGMINAARALWRGDPDGAYLASRLSPIYGLLFLGLLVTGISRQFRSSQSLGPEDVTAIVALAVPTVLLLSIGLIVRLPSIRRFLDESSRLQAEAEAAAE